MVKSACSGPGTSRPLRVDDGGVDRDRADRRPENRLILHRVRANRAHAMPRARRQPRDRTSGSYVGFNFSKAERTRSNGWVDCPGTRRVEWDTWMTAERGLCADCRHLTIVRNRPLGVRAVPPMRLTESRIP